MTKAKEILVLCLFMFLKVVNTTESIRTIPEDTLKSSVSRSELKSEVLRALDLEANDGERMGPLNNVVMGIYKNYKSTYLGNRTALEYVKSASRKSMASKEPASVLSRKPEKTKKRRTRKKKKKIYKEIPYSYDGTFRYNVGPGVNVSLDMTRDIVNVNLDEDYLKDILTGNWADDNNQGRRKKDKGNMLAKILPLFILPFLIQSAVIPFLLAKLKLLLINSILVGKLAIFLLVVSAFKNSQRSGSHEAVPAYYAEYPSRRSEAFNGYRVEGRPSNRVN